MDKSSGRTLSINITSLSTKITGSQNLRQGVFVSLAMIVNSFLGLIYYILVGRNLSVTSFGYFSFLLGLGVLAADLGDWGIDAAIIKFGGESLPEMFSLGILQRLIIGLLFIAIAVLLGFFFHVNFLLSALVAWFLLLLYLVTQSFLAKQKYHYYVGVNVFGNLIRLLVLALFMKVSPLSAESAIVAFILANAIAFLGGLALLQAKVSEKLFDLSQVRSTIDKIKNFSAQAGLSFIISSLAARIDSPAIYFLGGAYSAGIYSSAQRLTTVFPQLTSSLDAVFAPKFSSRLNIKNNLRGYLAIALLATVGIALLVPLSPLLVGFFGPGYEQAIPVFRIFLVGVACFMLAAPFSSAVLYYYGQSRLFLINSIISLTLTISLYAVFIPKFGAIGAAYTFVFVNVVTTLFFIGSFICLRKRHD